MNDLLPIIIGHVTIEDVLHAIRLYIIIHIVILLATKLYKGINKLFSYVAIRVWSAVYESACNWYYQHIPKVPESNSISHDEQQVQYLLGQTE